MCRNLSMKVVKFHWCRRKCRPSYFYWVLLVMCYQGSVDSVRITELRVAAHMAEGADGVLGCNFDMENETLYSLKWYKDGKEFFRYVPKAIPVMKAFYTAGVTVDLNRSWANIVTLKQLTRESTGVFQCEVKAEGPAFTVVSSEKHVTIDLLPKAGPLIYGLQKDYQIGSHVKLNCTTSPSRPEAQLKWLINGQPVPNSYLRGSYLVIPTDRPFTYQSKLVLDFVLKPGHFDQEGAVTFKCQATIPPLYHQETHYTFYEPLFQTTSPPVTIETPTDHAAMIDVPSALLFVQVMLILLVS